MTKPVYTNTIENSNIEIRRITIMDQLLQLYTELLRGATDEQIPQHLTSFVQDATTLADAINAVVNQARARVQPAQPVAPEQVV